MVVVILYQVCYLYITSSYPILIMHCRQAENESNVILTERIVIMYNMDTFHKRIHNLRKARGLTQEEFAGRLGVTPQAVSKWETGQSYPDITLLPAVAAILETDINELFGAEAPNDNHVFPENHVGLVLVHSYGNVACYSDKAVESTDGSNVRFCDGSTAELSNSLVRNVGTGEIKLVKVENTASDDCCEGYEKTKKYELPYCDSLDISLVYGQCGITCSNSGKTTVSVSGTGRFVRYHQVSVENGTLIIRCDEKGYVTHGSGDDNLILVSLPCTKGKLARMQIKGSADIDVSPDFDKGEFVISGSGDVNAGNIGCCDARINGSGTINVVSSDEASLSIFGSGDICACKVDKLTASVNGSGDVSVEKAVSLTGQINGSGDIDIDEICGGDVTFRICGSGDFRIGSGQCENLSARLSGSGEADLEGVTARRANIVIDNDGEVVLGCVLEESVEQVKHNGTVIIRRRR